MNYLKRKQPLELHMTTIVMESRRQLNVINNRNCKSRIYTFSKSLQEWAQ